MEQPQRGSSAGKSRGKIPTRLQISRQDESQTSLGLPTSPDGHVVESKVPMQGVSYPSPVRHLESDLGDSPIQELKKRMDDPNTTPQARENIRRILETYELSIRLNGVPTMQQNEDIQGGRGNKVDRKPEYKSLTTSFGRDYDVHSLPSSPQTGDNAMNDEQTSKRSGQSCQKRDGYHSDGAASLNTSQNSGGSGPKSPTSQLGDTQNRSAKNADKLLCVPAGWAPSSLSYSTVESKSPVVPAMARSRQKKVRTLQKLRDIEQEQYAYEMTRKHLEDVEMESEQKRIEQIMRNYAEFIQSLERTYAEEKKEREIKRELEEIRTNSRKQFIETSKEDEARRYQRHREEVNNYTTRMNELYEEYLARQNLYLDWGEDIEMRKEKLMEKEMTAEQRVQMLRQIKQREMEHKRMMNEQRLEQARARREKYEEETRAKLNWTDRLNKVEHNVNQMRDSFNRRTEVGRQQYLEKYRRAQEKFEREEEDKRVKLLEKETKAYEQVYETKYGILEQAINKGNAHRQREMDTLTRKDQIEYDRENALREVAGHVIDKSMKVDMIRNEKEEYERMMRQVRKLETEREIDTNHSAFQHKSDKKYAQALSEIEVPE